MLLVWKVGHLCWIGVYFWHYGCLAICLTFITAYLTHHCAIFRRVCRVGACSQKRPYQKRHMGAFRYTWRNNEQRVAVAQPGFRFGGVRALGAGPYELRAPIFPEIQQARSFST